MKKIVLLILTLIYMSSCFPKSGKIEPDPYESLGIIPAYWAMQYFMYDYGSLQGSSSPLHSGDILLVENYHPGFQDTTPYYYIATLKRTNNSVDPIARLYSNFTDTRPGCIAEMTWWNDGYELISEKEAQEIVKIKLSLTTAASQAKPVFIYDYDKNIWNLLSWGWAVQIKTPEFENINFFIFNAKVLGESPEITAPRKTLYQIPQNLFQHKSNINLSTLKINNYP